MALGTLFACDQDEVSIRKSKHDLVFKNLASTWDEAIPLGNAMLGALIWQKDEHLRFSLDRADLWDLRPMQNIDKPEWKYKWIYEQWKNNNYQLVHEKFDIPYSSHPAPSKIPAAAIEFNTKELGEVDSVRLSITDATCEVNWSNGARLLTFVHATNQSGWFSFDGINENIRPVIIPPAYNLEDNGKVDDVVKGQDLRRLGYTQGKVIENENNITYTQEGWNGFKYQVYVSWNQSGNKLEGCWSISSEFPEWESTPLASEVVKENQKKGFSRTFIDHCNWWNSFWAKSSINLPDKTIEKQWYLELYKFGSAARTGAPPISLQAVWTADNGKLPPWKGDFHNDLNTQLSYWHSFSSNHVDLEEAYIEWILKNKPTFEKYTRNFFETSGINAPGVSSLTGAPMGGWVQYSFSPTVSAWFGQYFYLHWRYTMDRSFLEEKAYPWIKEVAIHFDELSIKDENGIRKLPISASPEINNNSKDAWFGETTNFDLALIKFTYEKAAELANELGKNEDQSKWLSILKEWPEYAIDTKTGLKITPSLPYDKSHRHFSHLLAIHPLGLIDFSDGEEQKQLIIKTIENLKAHGTDWWVGYSFSWLANLQARMMDGDGAANTLRIFAENFCLPNSFHVNGEQHNRGYSKFKYRPFTLEGNFAFAAGVQEMLIQSHSGIVKLFPAIPKDWKELSFSKLRTEGAFLVSAEMKNGNLSKVVIKAEAGGTIKLDNTFLDGKYIFKLKKITGNKQIEISMKKGEEIILLKQ